MTKNGAVPVNMTESIQRATVSLEAGEVTNPIPNKGICSLIHMRNYCVIWREFIEKSKWNKIGNKIRIEQEFTAINK